MTYATVMFRVFIMRPPSPGSSQLTRCLGVTIVGFKDEPFSVGVTDPALIKRLATFVDDAVRSHPNYELRAHEPSDTFGYDPKSFYEKEQAKIIFHSKMGLSDRYYIFDVHPPFFRSPQFSKEFVDLVLSLEDSGDSRATANAKVGGVVEHELRRLIERDKADRSRSASYGKHR